MEQLRITPSDEGINKYLADKYGNRSDITMPKYRLAWSTRLTEKRFGTFRDFAAGGEIFIREVKEVREVLKYPFAQDFWVLETLNWIGRDKELVNETFSYDSIYIFRDKNLQPLPLNRDVCDIIIWFHIHRDLYTNYHVRMSELDEEQIQKDELEREYIRNKIRENDMVPHLQDLIW